MADAVPTPSAAEQGFPPRLEPFQPLPVRYHLLPIGQHAGQRAFTLILDTPDARSVTFWTEADLRGIADSIRTQLGEPTLTLADESDLQRLRDATPFMEGGQPC